MGEDDFVERWGGTENIRWLYRSVIKDLIACAQAGWERSPLDEDRDSALRAVAVAAIRYVRELASDSGMTLPRRSKAEQALMQALLDWCRAQSERQAKRQTRTRAKPANVLAFRPRPPSPRRPRSG